MGVVLRVQEEEIREEASRAHWQTFTTLYTLGSDHLNNPTKTLTPCLTSYCSTSHFPAWSSHAQLKKTFYSGPGPDITLVQGTLAVAFLA